MDHRLFLSLFAKVRFYLHLGTIFDAISWLLLIASTVLLASAIGGTVEDQPITATIVVLIVLLLCRSGISAIATILLGHSRSLLITELRQVVLRRLLAPASRGGRRTGDDTTIIGKGIDDLGPWLTEFLPARTIAGVIPIAAAIVIAVLDPFSVLVLLFAGPMLIVLLVVIGQRTRKLADQRFRELGWLRSFNLDMVQGIPTLKVFGRENDGADSIERMSAQFARTTMDVLRTAFQTSLVIEWAATAATALVAVEISFRMVNGDIPFGRAFAVLMLTPEFFAPLRRFAIEYHSGQTGNAVLEKLEPLLQPPATDSLTQILPPSLFIEFNRVSHRFAGDDRSRITDISLQIQPREIIALVGPSGAGKTTVASLLMGEIHPTSGEVTVDGITIDKGNQKSWMSSITSVDQRPAIITGTVAQNIALSRPDASTENIREAARLAFALDFIEQLPSGFETPLGEHGLRLSGGQRQRIAIARAFLRNAPIVILDEFTAHLDPDTEGAVIESMRNFLVGRTAVVIAHRGATVSLASRILRIEDGRIASDSGISL